MKLINIKKRQLISAKAPSSTLSEKRAGYMRIEQPAPSELIVMKGFSGNPKLSSKGILNKG